MSVTIGNISVSPKKLKVGFNEGVLIKFEGASDIADVNVAFGIERDPGYKLSGAPVSESYKFTTDNKSFKKMVDVIVLEEADDNGRITLIATDADSQFPGAVAVSIQR